MEEISNMKIIITIIMIIFTASFSIAQGRSVAIQTKVALNIIQDTFPVKYGAFNITAGRIFHEKSSDKYYQIQRTGSYETVFMTLLKFLNVNDSDTIFKLRQAITAAETDIGKTNTLGKGDMTYSYSTYSVNLLQVELAFNMTEILFEEYDAIKYIEKNLNKTFKNKESINYYPKDKVELIVALASGDLSSAEKIVRKITLPSENPELYQKACDMGNGIACSDLGWCYKNGKGVTTDYSKARELSQKACDAGSAIGCEELAHYYQYGIEYEQNLPKAAELYQKACDMGYADGCNNLGWFYQEGKGVLQNFFKASRLFSRACQLGSTRGCKNYDTVTEFR